MPTDYVGVFERMPAIRALVRRVAALDATRTGPDLRAAVADARALEHAIGGPEYVPATGGQSLPSDLATPANATRPIDALAGVAGGGGRRRVRRADEGR